MCDDIYTIATSFPSLREIYPQPSIHLQGSQDRTVWNSKNIISEIVKTGWERLQTRIPGIETLISRERCKGAREKFTGVFPIIRIWLREKEETSDYSYFRTWFTDILLWKYICIEIMRKITSSTSHKALRLRTLKREAAARPPTGRRTRANRLGCIFPPQIPITPYLLLLQ